MNILFLDHFNRHGGAQEYAIDLAKKFNEMGCRCYLPLIENETLNHLALSVPKMNFSLMLKGLLYKKNIFKLLSVIKKNIKEREIDIIHCNSVPSLIVAKMLRLQLPVVYTAHDCNLPKYKRAIIKHCSDHIVSVSNTVKENLLSLGINKPNDVIYNGLFDFEIESRHNDNIVIAVAGRIERTKGIDIFVDAALTLIGDFPSVEFHIIGISEDEVFFNELNAKVAGVDRILFRPFCNSKAELYGSIDVLVNCSRYCEPLGRTLIEAGIVSKPAIGPNRCGPAEIIEHGVSGLLFNSGDSGSLASALESILSDVKYRKKLGVGGRAVYEKKFKIENIAQQLLCLYKNELNEK